MGNRADRVRCGASREDRAARLVRRDPAKRRAATRVPRLPLTHLHDKGRTRRVQANDQTDLHLAVLWILRAGSAADPDRLGRILALEDDAMGILLFELERWQLVTVARAQ